MFNPSPDPVAKGGTVTLVGAGFFPGERVTIALHGSGVVGEQDFNYDFLLANGEQEETNPFEEDDNSGPAERTFDIFQGVANVPSPHFVSPVLHCGIHMGAVAVFVDPWIDRRQIAAFAAFAGWSAFGACCASSTPIACGGLSARSPWNTECRILPSRVHSPNETSHTSSGRTQWAPRGMPAPASNGLRATARGSSALRSARRLCSLKPVPTLIRSVNMGGHHC